jgi:starch-binding outer membrane protein, SusD/RagB family
MRNHNGLIATLMQRGQRAPGTLTAVAVAVLATAGCDDILSLKQSNPGQVDAATLYIPANAQLLVNSAVADFECAFSRYVTGTGILADEIENAIAQQVNFDYDRRTMPPTAPYSGGCNTGAQQPGIYTGVSIARATADTVYARFEEWTDEQVPNRVSHMATLAAYGGYSLLLLGEAFCTAAINVGPEMTSQQLFEEAKIRFDRAIAHASAAANATMLEFAYLGRARAYNNLGQHALARADAERVSPNFVVNITTDPVNTRRQNIVFVHINQSFFGTVDASFRNLELGGQPDPRVRVRNTGFTGTAVNTPIWTPEKYPLINTVMPVARYAEAQLIIAEARIAANDLAGAANAINAARNSTGRSGMPLYVATGQTQAQVRAQLIEERRREFFLEGRRLWDMRRFDVPLVPAPGAPYKSGGVWGDQRCFPLPNVERNNNPNIN